MRRNLERSKSFKSNAAKNHPKTISKGNNKVQVVEK
jgi:hypothetical protein